MDKLHTQIMADDLLDQLGRDGLVAQEDQEKIRQFILSRAQQPEAPLSLRILVGIGAFFASVSFIGFLTLAHLVDFKSPLRLIVFSLVFMGFALMMGQRARLREGMLTGDFLLQSSFCAMGIGKFLFLAGAAQIFPDHRQLAMAFAGLVLTALTYNIYAMSIDRFLSSFVTMFFFQLGISHLGNPHIRDFILMDGYFIFLALICGGLFMNGRARREWVPVGYAAALMMCGITFFLSVTKGGMMFFPEAPGHILGNSVISLFLVVCMMRLIIWAAGGWRRWPRQHLMMTLFGILSLGIIAAHGVMLAICLMILAYARHERWLGLMAVLYLPVYMISYYYNLDITLLQKSLILMSGGGLLLAGWAYMAWHKLDRRPV